jgi:hypothetical protein
MNWKPELVLTDDAFRRLVALGEVLGVGPAEILEQLLERVDEGIQRPGSWEYGWLAEVVGDAEVEEAWLRSVRQAAQGT